MSDSTISIEQKDLKELFLKIEAIKLKSDAITKATGGNYNIFRILGLGSDELIYSRMLTNLLQVNASHQMGFTFLRLFIEKLSTIMDIPYNFDYSQAQIYREYDIGTKINKGEESTGGRIDILIEIPSEQGPVGFVIENKIYAEDQKHQLIRYKNFAEDRYKGKYYILYLTLNGRSPSFESTLVKIDDNNTDENVNSNCFWHEISYKYFITEWLRSCIKEGSNYPYLRETLNQFLNQINRLTGQDLNKMNKDEIVNEICDNLQGAESVYDNFLYSKYVCALSNINTFLLQCKNRENDPLKTSPEECSLDNGIVDKLNKREFAFRVYREEWKNFFIRFAFEGKDLNKFKYGIGVDYKTDSAQSLSHNKGKMNEIRKSLDMAGADYSDHWLYRKYGNAPYENWTSKTIKSKNNPDLVKYLNDITQEMLDLINKIDPQYL